MRKIKVTMRSKEYLLDDWDEFAKIMVGAVACTHGKIDVKVESVEVSCEHESRNLFHFGDRTEIKCSDCDLGGSFHAPVGLCYDTVCEMAKDYWDSLVKAVGK